mmetsp:Transcript_31226/g.120180  ORF Transcript_31226/g.120180 Transcript_31226/m.120180 type:complete len:152 (-) Transcript_31226:517-972(-)
MLHREEVLPIVGQRFVEGCVVFLRHIAGLSRPNWFLLVEKLPLVNRLLHSFLLLFFFIGLLLRDVLDLYFVSVHFLILLLFLFGLFGARFAFAGDGMINYLEFLAATTKMNRVLTMENMRFAFEELDKDGNGTLSAAEVSRCDVEACKEDE